MQGAIDPRCTGMRVLNVDIGDAIELICRLHARQFASDNRAVL
jgi:hypothetical protein